MKLLKFCLPGVIGAAALLSGCGGGGDSAAGTTSTTAHFSLAVSDAPVDAVAKVMVCFGSVELVGNGQGNQTFVPGVDPEAAASNNDCLNADGSVVSHARGIDLLTLPGANASALVADAEVPAGNYGQLRLNILPGSYLEFIDGSRAELNIPSNQLKLNGPTLSAGGRFSYTLEFDLRKAVVLSNPQKYQLKPTGLRLVNTAEVGHIKGKVDEGLLLTNNCPLAPVDPATPVAYVYFYAGTDLNPTNLADLGGAESVAVYASAPVFFDGASLYQYQLGFVDAGQYTVALTCNGADDPEQDDDIQFISVQTTTVVKGNTTNQLDF